MRLLIIVLMIININLYSQDVEFEEDIKLEGTMEIEVNSNGTNLAYQMLKLENLSTFQGSSSQMTIGIGSNQLRGEGNFTTYPSTWSDGNRQRGFEITSKYKSLLLTAEEFDGKIRFLTGGPIAASHQRMVIDNIGFVGIGTRQPQAKLHVAGGDIFIDGSFGSKLIMKDINGGCHAIVVSAINQITASTVPCP